MRRTKLRMIPKGVARFSDKIARNQGNIEGASDS
jgi:hypothetical protein